MRKLLTAAALALLFPLAASAQARLGGKIGLGIPMGEAVDGGDLSSLTSLQLPLELNFTFAIAPNAYLGAYGGVSFNKVGSDYQDNCDAAGIDCTQHSWRVGAKGEYVLGDVNQGFAPYVGANFGWEWNVSREEGYGEWLKATYSGWELGLEAGADTRVRDGLTAGFFVNLTFGKYGKYGEKYSSGWGLPDLSISIPSDTQAVHEWLTLGVRGNFDLAPAR